MEMNDFQITLHLSLLHSRTQIAQLLPHGICPGEEPRGTFGLIF